MIPSILLALLLVSNSFAKELSVSEQVKEFIKKHEAQVRPLEKVANLAWWDANTSGRDEDFKRKEEAQNKLDSVLSNPATFQELTTLKQAAQKATLEPDDRRQLHLLYLQYLEKNVPEDLLKKMVNKSNSIEKTFNSYRAKVGGKEMTDSEIKKILKESTNNALRREAYLASKGVGKEVEKDLLELVKLRNEAAKKLGFKNFHVMMLALNEQDQGEVLKLFDELDVLTRGPFLRAKAEIDEKLSSKLGVPEKELRPWHYHDPFFQESPSVFEADLDSVYRNADILKLNRDFYAGIGLPIDEVIEKSDLYEKKGKSPHAFCTDIDREGDVRVLANIVPNEQWAGTMLHELGHAVYSSKNIPRSLPYLLRGESHILTTEGIAMFFGAFSKDVNWLKAMKVQLKDPKAFERAAVKVRRNELLIFSRWAQVMFRFEKALYENPEQDLGSLWWDLVERYQGLTRPEGRNAPDYGAKVHIVTAPAYYHNYLMGELFAAQVREAIIEKVLKPKKKEAPQFVGNPKVGEFLKSKVFDPGRRLDWNALTRFATGETLQARAFAKAINK
jgi:peptidyl-dipeptidase A